MIKSELIVKISDLYPHLFQRDVETIVNQLLDEIGDARVAAIAELRGFGSFSVKHRDARIGRNPRTGDRLLWPKNMRRFLKPEKICANG